MVHTYHMECLYIGQHLYEIKWTVPLTFRPWQGHNFVIDLGATREVSRFSPKMEVWTQKALFSNSGETSTFFPTEQHPKAIKNGQVCCQNHQTCERSLFHHFIYFCCNQNYSFVTVTVRLCPTTPHRGRGLNVWPPAILTTKMIWYSWIYPTSYTLAIE